MKLKLGTDYDTITVEGNHKSVFIVNDTIYIDGKPYKGNAIKVIVNGNVDKVEGADIDINGNISGDISGAFSITVSGNVEGNVEGQHVSIGGDVQGNIEAMLVKRGK